MNSSIQKKIKVISDLHLETYGVVNSLDFNQLVQVNLNDILCLVGDIGNPFSLLYKNFIKWCSQRFYKVFIIAGNHEYYNSTLQKTNLQIEYICLTLFNVHFLNNSSFIIDNTIFIGTTLWSFIPEEHSEKIEQSINDYKYILEFTTEICNQLHIQSVEYIKSSIQQYKESHEIIILSHHSPLLSNTSKTQLEKLPTNYAFSSDQSDIMKPNDRPPPVGLRPDIKYWIYGHTHHNHKNNYFTFNNIKLISNQLGYPNNYIENFNKNFEVSI